MLRSHIAWLAIFLVAASAGILWAADVNVTIREWDTPSPSTHPHDTEVSPDGALWYTGQYANLLGRLDPKSGKIQEFKLKTPDSGPHGLISDKEGNIWFTANNKAYIGKLNPKTGEVTEYEEWPSPGGRNSRPYAILVLPNGTVWYSESNVQPNTLVRFDPVDNSFMKWPIPSGGGVLRHFVATKDGTKIYIVSSGVNKVGIVFSQK